MALATTVCWPVLACPAVSRHVASRLGWQLVPPGSCDWDLCWLDTSVSQERLLKLQPTQVQEGCS